MKRVLVFGGSGQLGTALRSSSTQQYQLISPGSRELPLERVDTLRPFIEQAAPHVIINAAAYTRVDDAEGDRDRAFMINAVAPETMAATARALGARFIHVSTDYVFDGIGAMPYAPSATPNPLNVYGASKLAGEVAVARAYPASAIVRTAWVHAGTGTNFVGTAVRALSAGKSMRVVDDQVGAPTRAMNLARAILLIAEQPTVGGILHFTDAGVASWYDVACCVLDTLRQLNRLPAGVGVEPVDSLDFPRPAKRPRVSILDTHSSRAVIGWTPPHWRDGVIASTHEWIGGLTHA